MLLFLYVGDTRQESKPIINYTPWIPEPESDDQYESKLKQTAWLHAFVVGFENKKKIRTLNPYY